MKKRVVVSACLLGELCRYDGKSKQDSKLIAWLSDKEVISFCPEAPLFGTPRERISRVEDRVVRDCDGADVTTKLRHEIEKQMSFFTDISLVILKSKSPSCGLGTTPIYNKQGDVTKQGDGLAAEILKQSYTVVDEHSSFNDLL